MKTAPRFFTFVSIGLLAFSSARAQLAEEFRMWTNTAGKQIEATFVSVDAVAKTVKIKMKDGREFDVPIATLIPADFEYAKARYAAMQAAPAPAAPAVAMPAATPAATPTAAPKGGAKAAAVKKPAPPRPAFTITPVSKFKAPGVNDYLGGIAKVRPRLLQNEAGWAAIKGQLAVDPVLAKLMETLKASGEALLLDPELNRMNGEIRGQVSEGSRAIYRMGLLGALHYGDGDLKWKERAVREAILLCDKSNFRDWHPEDSQAVSDMVIAVCLAYDWFRDGFNQQQAAEIRAFLDQKGIDALVAHINDEPVPETAMGTSGGQTAPAKAPAKGKAKGAPAKAEDVPPGQEKMAAASALLLAAICFADEDVNIAKKAASAGAKVFGEGIQRFAPAGVWPEGLASGDAVMDYAAMVIQSLRTAAGKDLGLTTLEGIPQFGVARMHLYGPSGQPFNFGDNSATGATRPWVATWLCGLHGNPGIPAVGPGAKTAVSTAFFSNAGNYIYYNPHAAGDGTADSLEYAMPGGIVATVRSGWEKTDLFLAVKGGDNRDYKAQLDIGSFVLDAGGQRWGLELGAEGDRASGYEVKPGADRTKRFAFYLAGTAGQNTLMFDGNQDEDARAGVLLSASTPERGVGVIDMSKAYSKDAKDVHRGVMVVRGEAPYLVIQDDLQVKNTKTMTWNMQTKADILTEGATAKLTQGGKTLLATIVSPAGATFSTGEPPEAASEQARDLVKEKVRVLKAVIPEAKGPQSLCITFTTAETAPAHTHQPIAEWVKAK
ncbi:heparinase II/III family protein [Prosthecobacter sp.]|uniref:heparinase II/III domain-containing protein n=1 Tax=Prosthecobacter sp. TaxID=1965333 RepID=UPI001E05B019|nr:heparinase II/III family protein [Prosthecobacter sp.]MCB1279806.1 heparinase II/III family protein [Prosthecobacter sp.]